MVEPFSLAAIGIVALTEGVKFLYTQAGELLKHRRENRDRSDEGEAGPELRPPAEIIEGSVEASRPSPERLERLEGQVRELRRGISDYADGVEEIDPADAALLERIDSLRQTIEVIYGQRITFKGEAREPSGPLVENEVRATEARIRKSRVGTVEAASGTVKQTVDVTKADIEDSDVGTVSIGRSAKSSPNRREE
jgi:hypothetical protein